MRTIGVLIPAVIALLFSPVSAHADEATKNAKIEEMMHLSRADQMMDQLLAQIKTMTAGQIESAGGTPEARAGAVEMQRKVMSLVADRLSWDKVKPAFIKVYADTFTESEIDGILTFYKSPAGQAMVQKMPELTQKSMEVGQQLMGDVMPDIKRMADDMKKPQDNKQ